MNDPWDVKSVRQSGQYLSCMKINGVPLLPPLLSKECRKEMQYYKLLAKEVEKRISQLKPLYTSDSDSAEDITDAPELPESEQLSEPPPAEVHSKINNDIDKNSSLQKKSPPASRTDSTKSSLSRDNSITSNILIDTSVETIFNSKLMLDLPERDCDNTQKIEKEILLDLDTTNKHITLSNNKISKKEPLLFSDLSLDQDGPSSLVSSKSFTGSLNNIHTSSTKDSQIPKLIRQRSYTVLTPSPQLLAHLEIQSLSTGVDVTAISMSESLSNLSSPYKKRRSWDLETAKVKWSSMAKELKQNTAKVSELVKTYASRSPVKKTPQTPQFRGRSVAADKTKSMLQRKSTLKSEPIQKPKKAASPVRNTASNRIIEREPIKLKNEGSTSPNEVLQISPKTESEDPATKVRELYDKIQKQQLVQMASLVEKQKKEQMLLQQVFEEQNNLLYKQLKSICPMSPIEVKEAWGNKDLEIDRGPVSLSQLIDHKSPEHNTNTSPVAATLTETNNYISHCDNVLRKSRDISGSLRKLQTRQQSIPKQTSKTQSDGNKTLSPLNRSTPTSRRLKYDSSTSDREFEPILSDRTNDTMADLNVTFPSDCGEDFVPFNNNTTSGKESTGINRLTPTCTIPKESPRMEERSRSTAAKANNPLQYGAHRSQPTPREHSAASTIAAYAKGYLVRRLMRTERVQSTVQTIRDALLCALQLHQEREGIRGADVDLHRRLIQQITAACYKLHETFVTSSPAERCAIIAADRHRRRSLLNAARRHSSPRAPSNTDVMSQSHSGSFPTRTKRQSPSALMTQSNYETFSDEKCVSVVSRSNPPRRKPWR